MGFQRQNKVQTKMLDVHKRSHDSAHFQRDLPNMTWHEVQTKVLDVHKRTHDSAHFQRDLPNMAHF